jgi:hypothetical protein
MGMWPEKRSQERTAEDKGYYDIFCNHLALVGRFYHFYSFFVSISHILLSYPGYPLTSIDDLDDDNISIAAV